MKNQMWSVIRRVGGQTGQGKYHATINDAHFRASGGFPTVKVAKKWARDIARARKSTVAFEKTL